MKIAIHTWGSEGDVRPCLYLAERLAAAGHQVRVAYAAADGRDYRARLIEVPFAHACVGAGRSAGELHAVAVEVFGDTQPLRQLDHILKRLLEPVLDDFAAAAEADSAWADVLVVHPFAFPLAVAAEAVRKPLVVVFPAAMVATRAFPPPGIPGLGPLNGLGWWLFHRIMDSRLDGAARRVRARLGLEPAGSLFGQLGSSALDLVTLSPTLLARPADWPSKVHLSGFLSPVAAASTVPIDPALQAFFAAGPRRST